jgi:hypothetical protein
MSNIVKVILSCVLGALMYAFYTRFQPRIILTGDSASAPKQESVLPEMGWGEVLSDLEIKPANETTPLFTDIYMDNIHY